MPIGYLVTVAFVALLTVFALAPIRRPRSLALLSWGLSLVINELPFLAFYWLLAATLLAFGQGDIDSAGGWVLFGIAVLTSVGLGGIALRGWRAGPAVARAMSEGLGAGWRNELHPQLAARLRHHLPWLQILFLPILFRRHDVEGYGISRTATRAAGTFLIFTAHALGRLTDRRWSICTAADFPVGERAARCAPDLSPRKPGLGLHQRELPPQAGCHISRSSD
jgi:hypothetical protein